MIKNNNDGGNGSFTDKIALSIRCVEGGTKVKRLKFGKLTREFIIRPNSDRSQIHYKTSNGCMPNKVNSIKVADILEIRSGWATDGFNKVSSKKWFNDLVKENQCFSVLFRKPRMLNKCIDLVCNSSDIRDAWVLCLQYLVDCIKKEALHFNEENWLQKKFKEADTNNNGSLSFNEIYALLDELNLEISYNHAKMLFKEANKDKTVDEKGKQVLDFEEFKLYFASLTKRTDLLAIMREFSTSNNVYWSPDELRKFMISQGFNEIRIEECKKLINDFEPEETNKTNLVFTCQGFRKMMLSEMYGSIYDLSKLKIYQDMTKPLAQYYIKSSHNTYLCGHQLHGDSTVEGYITALKCGYKLLELDVWDGAEEPVITHGMTLVKPIYLKDVAKAIDRYAFCVSEFPVILSVENHCSKGQQNLMCKIFHEIFNHKLLTFPAGTNLSVFPSPDELKNKILIKAKISSHPKGTILRSVDQTDDGREDEVYDAEESDEDDNDGTSGCGPVQNIGAFVTRIAVSDAKEEKPKVQVIPDLAEITAMPNVKVKNMKSDALSLPFNGFAAFSEKKLDDVRSEVPFLDILAYTKRHFVKTYPSGLRVTSSNYDPVKFWNLGIQAVSLNAQTADDATDLNDAMFLDNGNCGYVLKPDLFIRDDVSVFRSHETTLKIKIISGHYLPKPTTNPPIVNDIVDPFVTVQIYGFDTDSRKYKTKTIDNNGFNPYWNETCQFKLKYPELALIRFLVEDYDIASSNDFVGEFSMPVRLLKRGYGHVRLRTGSRHHKDPTAVLFVHIEISESAL